MWKTGSLNWAQFKRKWFIRFTEFTEFYESTAEFMKKTPIKFAGIASMKILSVSF